MRSVTWILLASSFFLAAGCSSPPPVQVERRTPALGGGGSLISVICEFRYYLVGHATIESAPNGLEIIKKDKGSLTCAVAKPLVLLKTPVAGSAYDVGGFVMQIIEPADYAGEILTLHFDGPLASGDPFEAFAPGKRYQMDVSDRFIGDLHFRICY